MLPMNTQKTILSLGSFTVKCISEKRGGDAVKLGYSCWIKREMLVEAAEELDNTIMTCMLEQRKMTATESIMMEVLAEVAGFDSIKDLMDAHIEYSKGA